MDTLSVTPSERPDGTYLTRWIWRQSAARHPADGERCLGPALWPLRARIFGNMVSGCCSATKSSHCRFLSSHGSVKPRSTSFVASNGQSLTIFTGHNWMSISRLSRFATPGVFC